MSGFDPYREWLGLETQGTPTYYQLIGISPSEEDSEEIRRSALAQLNKLSQIKDPSKQRLRQQLIQRIKKAARCLLNEHQRIEYDRKLLAMGQRQSQAGIVKPEVEYATERPKNIGIVPNATPSPSVSRSYKTRQKRNNTLLLCLILGLLSCAGLLFLVVTQTDLSRFLGWEHEARKANAANTSLEHGAETLPSEESDSLISVRRSARPADAESSPDVTLTPQGSDAPLRQEQPTSEELQRLKVALVAARRALGQRDASLAKERLVAVGNIAMRQEDQAKFDRLTRLTDYVDGFWRATEDSLAKLQGGTEIVVDGKRMIVVENGRQELVVRMDGRNTTLQKDNLPLALEIALAERWFDEGAATTKVFRGAMMAVTPGFDPNQARELWRQAVSEGAQISDLEQVLDDNYDLDQ